VLSVTAMAYVDSTPGPEALTATIQNTSGTNFAIVQTSGPVSAGITSAAAVRRWRSLPTAAGNLIPNQFAMSASTLALLVNYKYLFPSPATGQSIWFRFRELAFPSPGGIGITSKTWQTFRLIIP
jgi:hypothetical protein